MKLKELLIHNGYLAQYRGEYTLKDRPAKVVQLGVSTLKASDGYDSLTGYVPDSYGANSWGGVVHTMTRTLRIQCDDWKWVDVEYPIPAPRNGKDYGWVWESRTMLDSAWVKVYWERCNVCYKTHNPAWEHCPRCERASVKPSKCTCTA